MSIKTNSRGWLWTGIVLLGLGMVGMGYFGILVYEARLEGIFTSLGVTDTLIKSFQKFECPWALNPGETGVVTVVFPYAGLYNSTQVTGKRLDVSPVIPPAGNSLEFKWEITARGGGNGILTVQAPAELDPTLPEAHLYWGSMYHQACSILVSVLGIPYELYLLMCLFLTFAAFGAFTKWAVRLKRNRLRE